MAARTPLRTTALVLVAAAGSGVLAACASSRGATGAASGSFEFQDPSGDDDGPGTYKYPTDAVYTPGSFDLTRLEVVPSGEDVEIRVSVKAKIEDPWASSNWGGNGFSVQMVFVHIDTTRTGSAGVDRSLPGLNVRFAKDQAWERVVIISPQGPTRVNSEIDQKCPELKNRIIVPKITRAQGRTLIAVVRAADLGGQPQPDWGYQVLMQSNEGFPAKTDLLTRKVNEYEGQHRFGGGTDYDNDPHVVDMLVPPAKGGADETQSQHAILGKYDPSKIEPKFEDLVVVPMVYANAR